VLTRAPYSSRPDDLYAEHVTGPTGEESALIVPVELPDELRRMRDRLDPMAALGVPGHITLLYPFVPSAHVDNRVLARVSALASGSVAFPFALTRVQRWPDVVCLLPEPSEPFRRLILALAAAFPDYPPYGGTHALADIVPHVTIGQTSVAAELDALETVLPGLLPVQATCHELSLIAHQAGRTWQSVWRYRLPTKSGG
jgi:2'-5' RNA ligase